MSISSLLFEKASQQWDKMLSHPFLKEVGEGTIKREAFDFWVAQDYIFVREALRFLGALELKSPDYDISLVLADAFGALKNELQMFEGYAAERGFSLHVEPTTTCRSYVDFLIATALTRSFEEAFSALWCAEKGYFDSWNAAKSIATVDNPYKRFIDNWTSDGFNEYVTWIENTLNRLLNGKPASAISSIEETFLMTAKYECLFWDMAYTKRS